MYVVKTMITVALFLPKILFHYLIEDQMPIKITCCKNKSYENIIFLNAIFTKYNFKQLISVTLNSYTKVVTVVILINLQKTLIIAQ